MSILGKVVEIFGLDVIKEVIKGCEKVEKSIEEFDANKEKFIKYNQYINKLLSDYSKISDTQIDFKDVIKQEIIANPKKFYEFLSEYDKALAAQQEQAIRKKSTKKDIDEANANIPNLKNYQYLFVESFNEAIRKEPLKFEPLYKDYITSGLSEVRGIDLYNIDDYIRDLNSKMQALKNPMNYSISVEVPAVKEYTADKVESSTVKQSENYDSKGYFGGGFSLGDMGKINLEIESEINLGKNELEPSLEDIAAKAEEISSNKLPVEEVSKFNDNLLTASFYGQQIGAAFMNVDENVGKAISSTATLTEGVAGIFKAFEGAETDGLALMGGIQGAFAGLQGLFGGTQRRFYFHVLNV